MVPLDDTLQILLDKTQQRSKAHGLLLHVQSGDGQVDFRGASGAAAPDMQFPIASIAKMYTATMIQQLCEAGDITLDQPVQSLLPDHDLADLHVVNGVAYGKQVTIRHLLFQTSGVADYYEGQLAKDILQGRDQAYDLDDVLRITKALPPQAAPDGGKAYYSDTNYQLLGAVIESVTGLSYDEALQARICAPLGLRKTHLIDPAQDHQLLPIYHKARRLDIPQTLFSMGPDGGILSDTGELMLFLRAFFAGKLFSPKALSHLQHWRPLTFPREYGGGLMRFHLPPWMTLWRPTPELIGHSGASGSFAYRAPERDIYLVGTFNQTDAPRRPFSFMLEVLRLIAKHGGDQ